MINDFQKMQLTDRTMKFKAFLIDEGILSKPMDLIQMAIFISNCPVIKMNNIIWSQWTGLVDINGVDIYENDICCFDKHYVHSVKFEDGCFYTDSHSDFNELHHMDSIEVVGNILTTPEKHSGYEDWIEEQEFEDRVKDVVIDIVSIGRYKDGGTIKLTSADGRGFRVNYKIGTPQNERGLMYYGDTLASEKQYKEVIESLSSNDRFSSVVSEIKNPYSDNDFDDYFDEEDELLTQPVNINIVKINYLKDGGSLILISEDGKEYFVDNGFSTSDEDKGLVYHSPERRKLLLKRQFTSLLYSLQKNEDYQLISLISKHYNRYTI